VKDFLDKWDRDYAVQNVTPKTRERYNQLVKNQINPNIGQVTLQKLRPTHLTDLYAKLLRGGLSARTVNHVHRLLHRVLWQASAWEVVKQNVATSVEPPKAEPAGIVILAPEQVAEVLKRVTGRTLRPIVVLALATGARRGELLALRIGDFDPSTHWQGAITALAHAEIRPADGGAEYQGSHIPQLAAYARQPADRLGHGRADH
jgi:integrase